MRKIYQKNWHGISLTDFSHVLNNDNLPGAEFYDQFYKKFNKKYTEIDKLDNNWLLLKKNAANFILDILESNDNPSVLSIGSGIGVIEKELYSKCNIDLHVQEVSEAPLKFLRRILPKENIHVGYFPDSMKVKKEFDFVILGGIEYVFTDQEFINFVNDVKCFLKPDGVLIILSWSLYEESFMISLREIIKSILLRLKIIQISGQFWGYLRTEKELTQLVKKSGFDKKSFIIDRNIKPWTTFMATYKKSHLIKSKN